MIRFSKGLINREAGVVIIEHGGFILEVAAMRVIGLAQDATGHPPSSPSGICRKV
jgi:hypothetical protein